MCTKLQYHVCLTIFFYSSNHVEYTRNSRLIEDESKHHENDVDLTEINFVLGKNGGHRPSSL